MNYNFLDVLSRVYYLINEYIIWISIFHWHKNYTGKKNLSTPQKLKVFIHFEKKVKNVWFGKYKIIYCADMKSVAITLRALTKWS